MKTEQQQTFVEQFCMHGNAAKAAEVAGYSHPKQRGYELKNKFAKEIEDKRKKAIKDSIPAAIAMLNHLMNNAESESVKLGAVKDILDRAGMKPTDKVEQTVTSVEGKSTEELQKELESLIGPLN